MKEVCIIGLKNEKEEILENIQDFGFLHPKEIQLPIGTQQPETEIEINTLSRINKLLEKIESMENKKSNFLVDLFGSPTVTKKIPDKINLKTIDKIEITINHHLDLLKNLEIEIKDLEDLKELLLKVKDIEVDFSFLKSSKVVKAIIGEVEIKKTKEFQKILDRFNMTIYGISQFSKNMGSAIIISHFSESDQVKEQTKPLLTEYEISRLIRRPKKQLKELMKKLNRLKKEHNRYLKNFVKQSIEWKQSLFITKGFLTNLKEKKDVQTYLGNTEKTFILCGWVPEKYVNQITSSLKNYNCWMNFEKVEDAPIFLDNPRIFKPFESFVKNYGYPSYKCLDPTFMLVLTIPIFFGFMMSDVVYGISILIASLLIKRSLKNKTTEWVSNIAIYCSVFTVLFGILFGSYAGFGFHPIWINPQEKPTIFLVIALIIGIIHTNIGILLNAINGIKKRDSKTVLDSISWFLIQFGVICGVINVFGLIKFSTTFLLVPLILGIGIRFFLKKLMGMLEIPGFFGNIFSYARLMVIALASIYIAFIINFSTGMLWKNYIPLAILLFVFGHMFNFLLGILGASVSSLRLHYVEFFSKFLEGEGIEYKPFRKNLIVEVV
jgi:V/A-type H+-transporting ATPase subunit I